MGRPEGGRGGRPIRFLTTRWGRLAYGVVGTGPPLVFDTGWIGDLEAMWRHPGYRAMVGRLAERHEVITFDPMGTGLSDRQGTTASIDDEAALLGLVLEAAGVRPERRASLFCSSIAASTAVHYAARHPELIDRLVLFGATVHGASLGTDRSRQALLALIRGHWGLGAQALVDIFIPDAGPADRQWFRSWQRACADGAVAAARLEMYYESDVSAELTRIAFPTLVIHRAGDRAVKPDLGAGLAAAIENAVFEVVPGADHLCFMGDWERIADLVTRFLTAPGAALPRGPYGVFTARETDVAELTMQGLSNAAIGQRLGISPRTVETHLTRIRQKLGVGTRAEVAAWMARRSEVR